MHCVRLSQRKLASDDTVGKYSSIPQVGLMPVYKGTLATYYLISVSSSFLFRSKLGRVSEVPLGVSDQVLEGPIGPQSLESSRKTLAI